MLCFRFLSAGLLGALLAACSGGSSSQQVTPLSPLSPNVLVSSAAVGVQADELTSAGRCKTVVLRLAPRCPVAQHIYVGNSGNNSITVYGQYSNGNVRPERTIAGPNTLIDAPGQISLDRAGNLYVASTGTPAILVFARGANGNVAPKRVIAGAATTLHRPTGMRVDPATGDIYVVDNDPADPYARFLRFAARANGNVGPIAQTAASLSPAFQIAFDSSGANLIEAHNVVGPEELLFGIDTYRKYFKNGAAPNALYDISALIVRGIADDPSTQTYLALSVGGNVPTGIIRFEENTVGIGQLEGPAKFTPPVVSLSETQQRCGENLALDDMRNVYVAACPSDSSIAVYRPNATGLAAPLRQIAGPATNLDHPYGIDIGL
jgi:hypothetical protein